VDVAESGVCCTVADAVAVAGCGDEAAVGKLVPDAAAAVASFANKSIEEGGELRMLFLKEKRVPLGEVVLVLPPPLLVLWLLTDAAAAKMLAILDEGDGGSEVTELTADDDDVDTIGVRNWGREDDEAAADDDNDNDAAVLA
jgi:hypothetical protein